MPISIEELPRDCVFQILVHFNTLPRVFLASMVCKLWKQIVQHDSFPVNLNLKLLWGSYSSAKVDISVVQKVSNRVRYLSVLSSPHARKSSGEFYRDQRYHLLPKFPALKSIISGERLEIYDAAEVIYECCPDTIENLHIAVRQREKGGFDAVPPSHMERYGYATENIVTWTMNRILSFSKLTSLHVSYSVISNAIQLLQGLPLLTSISLERVSGETQDTAQEIAQLHHELFNHPNGKIVKAHLDEGSQYFTVDAPRWTSFTGGGSVRFNCPNLENLSISSFSSFVHLNTPKLTHLHIQSRSITLITAGRNEDTFSFPSSLLELDILNAKDLWRGVEKYGSALDAVARDCPDMHRLCLQYCGIPREIRVPNFPKMEHLDLSYSIETTKIVFDTTGSQPAFPKLATLDVTVCSKLLALEVSQTPQNKQQDIFPSMKHLILSSCWRGDIQNFVAFAQMMPNLTKISADELPAKKLKLSLFGDQNPTIHTTGTESDEAWAEKRKNDPFLKQQQKV